MDSELVHYRVNANIGDLRQGEVVAIDPAHPYWSRKIERGYLRPEPPVIDLADFEEPEPEPPPKPAPKRRRKPAGSTE